MVPKKWEIWRTMKYLSDNFYDKTELVNIIDVVDIWNDSIVRYRENINVWTHILLTVCTWWIWLLMYYGDTNLNEKRVSEFIKICIKI